MEKDLQILLVDDDEDEYILLKDMIARLPGHGMNGYYYRLEWVSTFDQSLEACTKKQYDLYLVDYHLGKHNGLDVVRAAEELGCSGPFILLTGQGSYEIDLAAMQLGVYDYLLKDQLNEALLERTIRYALERRQAQEELERRVRERTQELAQTNEELKAEVARRARAEEIMRESEERFRTLAEITSAAIFIVQDGLVRYANPATRYVTGYAPEELQDTPLWKLAHPAYQAPLRDQRMVSHWAENVPARYEIKIIHKNGEERWVDITTGNMQYAGRTASVFTAFDITERDMAEQALRKVRDELEVRVASRTAELSTRTMESQATSQRLQAVLRTLPVAIIITDEHGAVIGGNQAFSELWSITGRLPSNLEEMRTLHGWRTGTNEQISHEEWPLVRAVTQGQAVVGQVLDIQTGSGARKTIINSAVPIIDFNGRVTGAVSVSQDITDQRQLEQRAQAAAREAQQHADELEGLHRATAALLSTLDLDELLCQILDAAQRAIPAAERGMLHLVSPSTGQLQMRATLGFTDERICVIRSPKEPGFPAKVVRDRRPLLVADAQAKGSPDKKMGELTKEMKDARSIILAPMYYGEQVLGTLSLTASVPNAFTESNLRLLASFAATTTAALQNAILHAEIKQLAVTDPLTGQYNRRAFFDIGQRELDRYQHFNHPLTAVMIDLDNFKDINDTYGHAVGDQILHMVAERCRKTIRDTDIFGRYGGDEFALLLPNTDVPEALHIANRIRDEVVAMPWLTDQGPVVVSVSLGVAQAAKNHHILEELLSSADQALYKAKSGGKNRVEVLVAEERSH